VKVLIADDDPVSRRFLQVTLGNSGYETVMAVNGAEALLRSNGRKAPGSSFSIGSCRRWMASRCVEPSESRRSNRTSTSFC